MTTREEEQGDRREPQSQPEREADDGAPGPGLDMRETPLGDGEVVGAGAVIDGRAGRRHACEDEAERRRRDDDDREGDMEQRQRGEGEDRDGPGDPGLQRARADAQQSLDDQSDDGAFDAIEDALHPIEIGMEGIERAEGQHDRRAGQDEQKPGDEASLHAVGQPAGICGELLRLGPRQEHAEIQRVQVAHLAEPAFLLNDDAVHQGDLRRRPAEAQKADARESAGEVAERRHGGRHGAAYVRHMTGVCQSRAGTFCGRWTFGWNLQEDFMADLITTTGRALKSVTPSLSSLEATISRQAKPLMKTLGRLDAATLAKMGGGAAAVAALYYAARALIGGGSEGAKEVKASAGRVAKAAKAGAAPSAGKAKAAAKNVIKRGKATAAKATTKAKAGRAASQRKTAKT